MEKVLFEKCKVDYYTKADGLKTIFVINDPNSGNPMLKDVLFRIKDNTVYITDSANSKEYFFNGNWEIESYGVVQKHAGVYGL